MTSTQIYTLGFTRKSAQTFFELIRGQPVKTLIDVRLSNRSQLAGFARRDDLAFFLRELCDVDYVHWPELAPTRELLSGYRKGDVSWPEFEDQFMALMAQRRVEHAIDTDVLKDACLLCSEHEPHYCHRRLLADYLNEHAGLCLRVHHLM